MPSAVTRSMAAPVAFRNDDDLGEGAMLTRAQVGDQRQRVVVGEAPLGDQELGVTFQRRGRTAGVGELQHVAHAGDPERPYQDAPRGGGVFRHERPHRTTAGSRVPVRR